MILHRSLVTAALVTLSLVTASGRPALAEPAEDFAYAVKEATGEYYTAWVITKLTTFKVGAKCLQKLADKDGGPLHTATFYTRDIAEYAKALTGDDWSRIESQNNSDRENNKKLVEPMMDAFKAKFNFTISIEGDDCDSKFSALWTKYWGTISTSLRNYPPKAAKVSIVLEVKAKAKDVSVVATKDGSKFTITAPRDIEPGAWSDKIDLAFKKIAKPL